MASQTFSCAIALTLISFAAGAESCDSLGLTEGDDIPSGGAEYTIIKCAQWNTLEGAKSECLSTAGCDGFPFGKSGAAFCLRNHDAAHNQNEIYTEFLKHIKYKYDLQGDGQCSAAELLVSQGKLASQSSLAYDGAPGRAIDGDANPNYSGGSCTHTQTELNPWWQVDLGASYTVTRVLITNRLDCCHERLRNLHIRVGESVDSKLNAVCATGERIGKGETMEFKCALLRGRHVTVSVSAEESLTLCEVQVFALVDGKNR
ncbi:hypothetical protein BSKO_12456 [Bryopsis sp. KO-2023]|nr:hypothetical protein BSKO_12456 [Bryopsis sp. KO-2023]